MKDVSFEVKQGEVVGIIGRNGAGKSTLLKILAHITEPTEGRVRLRGRVGSLLEVGTGFHPELTGRENIYLNGAILGMKKAEIERKFDEIVAFAEIEKFLDTPVKHYSSGMYVRLAFAVAAHLEPEILVVDEVLAVGDVAFQKKCMGKMGDVSKQGRTIMLVSHNMAAIQHLCLRTCLLQKGQLALWGKTNDVVDAYVRSSMDVIASTQLFGQLGRQGNGRVRFTGFKLYDGGGQRVPAARTGKHLIIGLAYKVESEVADSAVIRLGVTNLMGQRLFMCLSRVSHYGLLDLSGGDEVLCHIPRLPLLPGKYSVSAWCKIDGQLADDISTAFTLDVLESDFYNTGKLSPNDGGDITIDHSWEVR